MKFITRLINDLVAVDALNKLLVGSNVSHYFSWIFLNHTSIPVLFPFIKQFPDLVIVKILYSFLAIFVIQAESRLISTR